MENYNYIVGEKNNQDDFLCIGVDGCHGGWIAAVITMGKLTLESYKKIEDILKKYNNFSEFLIDMPIGLPSNQNDIRPDALARKIVSPKTPTIFPVPSRSAVYAASKEEQITKNEKDIGKRLSNQSLSIIPKMRELDTFLQEHTEYKNVIKESHPEVCFARLNGSVAMSKKTTNDGQDERLSILMHYLPELNKSMILKKSRELNCNKDDIIDAICLAVTGRLSTLGKAESIPEKPAEDSMGLLMQMIIPKTK